MFDLPMRDSPTSRAETLLFIGTFLVLFVSIVASCALLYREGTHELPGTLSSVSLRS